MKIPETDPLDSLGGLRLVGHAGDTTPMKGTYRCLCCGVVVWRLRKGQHFPECPTHNCPTMWLWSEP